MASNDEGSEKKSFNVVVTGFGAFGDYPKGDNPSWLAVDLLNGTSIETDTHIIRFTTFRLPTSYDAILEHVPLLHARPPVLPPTRLVPSPNAGKSNTLGEKPTSPSDPLPVPPKGGYDLVLHLGAGRPGNLVLEMQGHKTGYNTPDWDGYLPPVIEEDSTSGSSGSGRRTVHNPRSLLKRVLAVIGFPAFIIGRIMAAMGKKPVRGFGKGYKDFDDPLKSRLDVPALVEHMKCNGFEHTVVSNNAGYYCCDFIFYCSLAESVRKSVQSGSLVQFMHVPPPDTPYPIEVFTDAVREIARWASKQ